MNLKDEDDWCRDKYVEYTVGVGYSSPKYFTAYWTENMYLMQLPSYQSNGVIYDRYRKPLLDLLTGISICRDEGGV